MAGAESASDDVEETIMTVTGPLAPSDFPSGPVFCREWLLNDQPSLLERVPGGLASRLEPGDRLQLENLAKVRRWPCCILHNLHLSLEDCVSELCGAFRERGKSVVVVCTPREFWGKALPQEHAASLLALSKQAGHTHIVCSTAPLPSSLSLKVDFEVEVARLVSDFAVGYTGGDQNPVRPGVLGELPLWGFLKEPPMAEAALALRICVEAQIRTGAPLLMSGPVTHEAYAILNGKAGPPGSSMPCLWKKCAFFDVPQSSPVQASQLATHGALLGFCPPHGGADIATPYEASRPLKTEEQFLAALSAAPSEQTLLSSGLRFRTDLAAGGGVGLDYATQLLELGDYNVGDWRKAGLAFLKYPWKPPAPPEEVPQNIECHWCGTWKKKGSHFSKFNFDYCSPKCLTAHRKVDFAPNVTNQGAA